MSNPAAWHPDPTGKHEYRYWDGERWTEHVSDSGQVSSDPLEGGAPSSAGSDADASSATGTSPGDQSTEAAGHDPAASTSGTSGATDQGDGPAAWADGGSDAGAGSESPSTGWGSSPGGESQTGGDTPPSGAAAWQQPDATGQQSHTDPQQTWQQPQADWQGSGTSGAPSWQYPAANTSPAAPSKLPMAAMIVGIASIPALFACGLGAISGIVAIVLGFIGLSRIKRDGAGSKGQAWTGIITGFLALVIGVVVVSMFLSVTMQINQCIEETGSEQLCAERFEDDLIRRFGGA